MADIGVRLVVLGLAEFRRGISTAQQDVSGFERAIRTVSGTAAGIGTSLTSVGNTISGVGRSMSLFITGPLVAMGAGFVRAGIQFEDAFAGVGKVVSEVSIGFDEIAKAAQEKLGITITNMDEAKDAAARLGIAFGDLTPLGQDLRQQFIDLGNTIPIPVNELAKLGQVVGQLGVPADKLIDVTKLIAEFSTVTGISAEDAASSLLHLGNILEGSSLDFEDFTRRAGSAVIALGNASVSTEPEILALATRIAAAGDRAKFSEPDLLAWATAISDVGVRAELGGTAVSRAITEMLIAVQTGGEGIQEFAQISGQGVEQFRQAFEEDASGALQRFVAGLKNAFEEGTITKDMLEKMGLSGVRAIDVMGRLGNIQEILADRLATSNEAWDKQIQIEEAFEKRTNTVQSMIQIMKNQFAELGITIFDLVKGDLEKLISKIGEIIQQFIDLDPNTQKIILGFVLLAAAIGPVLIIAGSLISSIGIIITALAGLATPLGLITILLGGLGLAFAAAFGPKIIESIAAGKDPLDEIKKSLEGIHFDALAQSAQEAFGKIKEAINNLDIGGIFSNLDVGTTFETIKTALTDMGTAITNTSFQDISDFITGFADKFAPAIERTKPLIEDLFSAFNKLGTKVGPLSESITKLFNTLSGGTDFKNLGEIFANLAEVNLDKTIIGLTQLVDILSGVAEGATKFVGFVTNVAKFLQNLPQHIEEAKKAVSNFVSGLKQKIDEIITNISDSIVSTATNIKDSVVNGVTNAFNSAKEAVSNAIEDVKSAIQDKIEEIKTSIDLFFLEILGPKNLQRLKLIPDKVAEIFDVLKTRLEEKITEIASAIGDKVEEIKTAISDKFAEIITSVSDALTPIKDAVVEKFSEISEAVSGKVEEIKTSISDKWTEITTIFSTKSEEVKTAITTKFTEIKDGIINALTPLTEWAGTFFEEFKLAVNTKFQELSDSVTLLIETLKLAVNTKFQEMKDSVIQTIQTFVEEFLGWFDNLYAELVGGSIVPDLVAAIIQHITDMKDDVLNDVATLVSDFIGKITELKDQAVNLFTDMQQKVSAKIKQIGDDMTAAMHTASGAVDGVIKALESLLNWLKKHATELVELVGSVAGALGGMGEAGTNSPEFITEHAFVSLKDWLNANTEQLTNQVDSIGSALSGMSNKSLANQLTGDLNNVPVPAQNISNITTDSSVNTTINGASVQNNNDLASLIDQRVRVARGTI